MSEIENKPIVAEDAPAATTAPVEPTIASEAAPAVEPTTATEGTPATTEATPATTEAPATTGAETADLPKEETIASGEAKVEATPASEGTLGFKHPPFPKTLRFSKNYFWFSDEPVKAEHLTSYVRETKAEVAHPTAAWARESGKGLLFYAKRAEDKSAPSGIINLSEVTDVTKEGSKDFSFKVKGAKYIFAPENAKEQASWLVALETKVEEAKSLKESITGSEGYKSSLSTYAKPATLAASTGAVGTAEETKTKDATAPTPDKKEIKEEDKAKSRSQSRNKRASIFGSLLNKKDEIKEKHEVKKEEKEEQKEEKKEEPAAGESSTAKDTEAAAAATGVAAVATEEHKKQEDKTTTEDSVPATHAAATEAPATTTAERPGVDKQKKRGSVFGSFFNKKEVTSPTTEKTENEVAPEVPAKDDVPPVAETAPKIEEPSKAGPIDTAAVTAPVDDAIAADKSTEETKTAKPTETTQSSSKGGILGFLKKQENKVESKVESKKAEKNETPAAATTESSEAPAASTEEAAPTTEGAAAETTPKEKRRTSIFGTLSGTIKKKTNRSASKSPAEEKKEEKKEETPAAATAETTPAAETKETGEATTEPLTNGSTAAETKETIGDVPGSAIQTAPEVSATA